MAHGPTRVQLALQISKLQENDARLARENEVLHKETELAHQRLREEQDYAQVLAGDRDRLTATIEVMSRRLASPTAERLLARAGWRAGNLIGGEYAGEKQAINQGIDPRAFPRR